jgi:hypothetical protein
MALRDYFNLYMEWRDKKSGLVCSTADLIGMEMDGSSHAGHAINSFSLPESGNLIDLDFDPVVPSPVAFSELYSDLQTVVTLPKEENGSLKPPKSPSLDQFDQSFLRSASLRHAKAVSEAQVSPIDFSGSESLPNSNPAKTGRYFALNHLQDALLASVRKDRVLPLGVSTVRAI